MTASAYDHIEEAWGLDGNPFPHSAISSGWKEPYSAEVFPEETATFHQKMIRGAIQGGRQIGFLWSKGPGGDTGYGKTALMRATVREINADWGRELEIATGMKEERLVPIVAGFSELNTISRTGLFPVLFNAVVGIATGPNPPLVLAHERIRTSLGSDDPEAIATKLSETRLKVAPTASALRPELVQVFSERPTELGKFLGEVSDASQIRNGIQYLQFAMIALAAAGAGKIFLMIDQLEDLATNKALSRAKRQREIGRIRDLMETEPYASMLHLTFTFHATAARELESFWEQNRLPSFEDTASNQAAVVVLRGMRDDDQVEALLKAWLEPHRNGNPVPDELVPFNRDALTVLRYISEGRPGILLNRAHEVFASGAEAQVGTIDAA
ncbi:MAG TPA: hypothetical protein VN999_09515, partial [Thermoanaerobaculia bacterium]|nr:hypothetical protein [Thermoanaerobaculia bacterium]